MFQGSVEKTVRLSKEKIQALVFVTSHPKTSHRFCLTGRLWLIQACKDTQRNRCCTVTASQSPRPPESRQVALHVALWNTVTVGHTPTHTHIHYTYKVS